MQLEFEFKEVVYVVLNLDLYRLIYIREGIKYLGRSITRDDYILLNGITGKILRLNRYELRRDYKPLTKLNKLNKRRVFMNYGKRRLE